MKKKAIVFHFSVTVDTTTSSTTKLKLAKMLLPSSSSSSLCSLRLLHRSRSWSCTAEAAAYFQRD